MAATARPLKAGVGARDLGTFRAEKFSLFESDDLERYAELRNKANDASSGIKIETMREYSRKTTCREGSGNDQTVTTSEEIILLVQYWENPPKRNKGDSDEEIKEARRDWSNQSSTG